MEAGCSSRHGAGAAGDRRPRRGRRCVRAAAGQKVAVGRFGVGADSGEQIGPVGAAQSGTDVVGWAAVGGLAAGGQKQHLIADVQVGQAVGDHQHDAPGVGESTCRHGYLAAFVGEDDQSARDLRGSGR